MYDGVVDPEKKKTLEELQLLDKQVEQASEFDALRPIFYRVEEIALQHPADVDVQVMIGDLKQRIMQRGTLLKAQHPQPSPATTHPGVTDLEATAAYPFRPRAPSPPADTLRYAVSTGSGSPGSHQAMPAGPPVPPILPPPRPAKKKRGITVAISVIALVAAIAIAAILARSRISLPAVAARGVAVQVATVPPGASVRVNGEVKCTSPCSPSLPPGNYQIAVELAGYQPVATSVTLATGQPVALNLTLQPQPESVRIVTDLRRGRVALDSRPAASLQRGRYTFENVEPGRHTAKVSGPEGDASFSFDLAPARLPGIMGTVAAHNVEAVLVASFGNQARVVTSSGPWKLAVGGRRQLDDAGPAGVDLSSFEPGPEELVIEQGSDRRSMKENFGPAPTLTAFLSADPKGTLIVSTGEEGARVFLNDREYPRRTQDGELRIPTLGSMVVRVMKDGFESPPVQPADVKKGATVRLEFKMTPSP